MATSISYSTSPNYPQTQTESTADCIHLTSPHGTIVPVAYTMSCQHIIGTDINTPQFFMNDQRDIVSTTAKPMQIFKDFYASIEEVNQWPARALPGVNYELFGFRKIVLPRDVKCCGARNVWIDPRNAQDIATINKYIELSLPTPLKVAGQASAIPFSKKAAPIAPRPEKQDCAPTFAIPSPPSNKIPNLSASVKPMSKQVEDLTGEEKNTKKRKMLDSFEPQKESSMNNTHRRKFTPATSRIQTEPQVYRLIPPALPSAPVGQTTHRPHLESQSDFPKNFTVLSPFIETPDNAAGDK